MLPYIAHLMEGTFQEKKNVENKLGNLHFLYDVYGKPSE